MKKGTPDDYVFYRDLNTDFPVAAKADGIYIYDTSGKKYIDGVAGVCVVCIGHNVKEIHVAINKQLEDISFCYHINFANIPQAEFAERIINMAPGYSKVFFLSGGSEANETAMKLAREYHIQTGNPTKYKVIGRWNSYHGNTMGALSMSGHRSRRKHYNPYLLNFPHISACYCYRCPYGKSPSDCDVECALELEKVIKYEGAENISAFIGEPISATYGLTVPPKAYWPTICEICDRHNILLIADEVITGFGRTGKNFAVEHWGLQPDFITAGKGISSGYSPLAAVVINQKVVDGFKKGSGQFGHSFTYIGNPLSCAAGMAVQDYVAKHDLVNRVAAIENYVKNKLNELSELDIVGPINGLGLLWGIEFVANKANKTPFPRDMNIAERIVQLCFDNGLVTLPTVGQADGKLGDAMLLAPPFVIEEEQIDQIVDIIKAAILKVQKEVL